MEENRSIVVLSLFDGMSGGQTALKELGIIPEIYYASEIDKHAIGETQLNFPNTIQLGSVTTVYVANLKHIDLLIGGSPCQSFSFAGKRKGMSTKSDVEIYTLEKYLELKEQGFEFAGQSYLFWEYMRILTDIRKYNPNVKFLLENVEMGNKWERVLSEAIGLYGVHINSALVSAQNRKRIYWTNIRTKQVGLFGELHADIPQPKDEGILLRDVLERDVPEKYYLSDKMLNYFDKRAANFNNGKVNVREEDGKATTITASCKSVDISDNFIKVDKQLNPKADQEKASCFTAGAHSGGNHSDMDLICVAMRGRNPDNPSDRRTGSPTEQRLEPNLSGKTNCLTSVQKDNLVLQINPSKESGGVQPYQQNRVYDPNGISPAVLANMSSGTHAIVEMTQNYVQWDNTGAGNKSQEYRAYYEDTKAPSLGIGNAMKSPKTLLNNQRIRRLTPTEVARLQTVPDWYKWACSDTQIYRMCGNGWTIKVISWIFSFL